VPIPAWPVNSQGKVNRAEVIRLVNEQIKKSSGC
jgi:hypothetical protein